MFGNAVANPLFGIVLGGWDYPLLHGATDNALEGIANLHYQAEAVLHQRGVAAVAENQSIVVVVECKTFGDGFDRF